MRIVISHVYYVTCPFIKFQKRCWHVKLKTSSGFMVIYVVNMCIYALYVYFRMVQEKDTKLHKVGKL